MPVQVHQVIEIDCPLAASDCQSLPGLTAGQPPMTEAIARECLAASRPKASYRLFNTALCTLPPAYTEPAIKLVGTMMVFHGEDVYRYLKKSARCALMAVTLGPACGELLEAVQAERPAMLPLYESCCTALLERAADKVNARIACEAFAEGLMADGLICPGEGDFPTGARSQILFYTQAEKLLGITLDEGGRFHPATSLVAAVGIYDSQQKGKRRTCAKCRHRDFCSIRAIGMRCHGRAGSFERQ